MMGSSNPSNLTYRAHVPSNCKLGLKTGKMLTEKRNFKTETQPETNDLHLFEIYVIKKRVPPFSPLLSFLK